MNWTSELAVARLRVAPSLYEVIIEGRHRSVSLATVELAPEAAGTRLAYTEHYVVVVLTVDGRADIAVRGATVTGTRAQNNGAGFGRPARVLPSSRE